ncbi:hypothetical protein [Pseudobacteriovorax antillogorgiicola]|uniref:Outer membrane protein beta-barrel domain-containing protein n=1 Tax=Pseudobacteriovorax antillogorgiicola TaxID=1513793 RepID=A0A1Y6BT94_9BACT|nr:hypothetical protein [Pseudobacteriovorax antillogorgiicola]TCS53087.1 hypothetical protein EDD56_108138 [Pseudobacteriovorax antillogorgiicola]SMF26066.1 hypothetical protein SAMN06296036_108109 [Pseudobacteriovorax antillogorgiicola]
MFVVRRFFLLLCLSTPAQAMHLGVGFASHTSGRMVPSFNGGFGLGSSLLVSGTSSGVATKAYYSNQYSLSFLYRFDFGKHWFGQLKGGMGVGATYGTKAVAANPDADEQDGVESEEQGDVDSGLGPAFRIAFNPFSGFYIGLDYVLAIGPGAIGNGWGDVGMFALGLEI